MTDETATHPRAERATPKALITGITGQDGSYLAELLLEKGIEVHGVIRTTAGDAYQTSRIAHLISGDEPAVTIHVSDLTDEGSLSRMIDRTRPTEIYNLAAQSHVRASFDLPVHTGEVTGLGTTRILEAIRNIDSTIRFYQASSSEMFGSAPPPQSEKTPFHPRSPYAVAKVYAYWSTVNYREAYGIYASNGILFNHESPRRGRDFVTRKITDGVAQIAAGKLSKLRLGNLDARRDWGHARDYVEAMYLILQADEPLDLVIGTGESHTVREFLERAFGVVGLDWEEHVEVDPRFFRPSEVDYLEADASLAAERLGWTPSTSFEQLVAEMVEADCARHGIDV